MRKHAEFSIQFYFILFFLFFGIVFRWSSTFQFNQVEFDTLKRCCALISRNRNEEEKLNNNKTDAILVAVSRAFR